MLRYLVEAGVADVAEDVRQMDLAAWVEKVVLDIVRRHPKMARQAMADTRCLHHTLIRLEEEDATLHAAFTRHQTPQQARDDPDEVTPQAPRPSHAPHLVPACARGASLPLSHSHAEVARGQARRVRQLFFSHDTDKSGALETDELHQLLRELGHLCMPDETLRIMSQVRLALASRVFPVPTTPAAPSDCSADHMHSQMDTDGDGKIGKEEFFNWWYYVQR